MRKFRKKNTKNFHEKTKMKDRKSSTERSEQNDRGYTVNLPPEVSLPILVFIDMFAVALVVPLLVQYYKRAGVTSATQRELLSSVSMCFYQPKACTFLIL